MSNKIDDIKITLKISHPQFLAGLDMLLRLGLISDEQIKELSATHLSSTLPETVATLSELIPEELSEMVSDFAIESIPIKSAQTPRVKIGILQSLMAELSVRWLLFLGVFLVVISSGVLAASQWEKFPSILQYGVLLGYTVIFWGVSFWAGKQPNLGLTTQTLQVVTLLLIPVNFWGMDSFGLWHYPWEWVTVAIASTILSYITFLRFKNSVGEVEWLPLLNILGLSYLHWGWQLSGLPLIAIYMGMVLTSIITFYQNRRQTFTSRLIVVYGLIILLVRAIFVIHIPVAQLGLAMGICGGILAWLEQNIITTQPSLLPWDLIGGGLLFIGWLVSVNTPIPAQATVVSIIGLWFLFNRLRRFWRQLDLTIFFGLGLQTIWLCWRLIPLSMQQWAITTLTKLTAAQDFPLALLSVVLFPYIILMVAVTEWIYNAEKPSLAKFGEYLTLILGTLLTSLGCVNPGLRTFNLLLSTLTLFIITQRRSSTRITLIYFTHIMGILTLLSAIDYFYPHLHREIYASIFLAVMLIEWRFSLGANLSTWKRSAWHIGLVLSGLSYVLLLSNFSVINPDKFANIWLITPGALTIVASQSDISRQKVASWLSVITLFMYQIFTITIPETRLISLSFASTLMFFNTVYLRQVSVAVINIGFGLTLVSFFLWDILKLTGAIWFLVGALTLSSLWIIRGRLLNLNLSLNNHGELRIREQEFVNSLSLLEIYAQANDKWAIAITGLELLNLTFHDIVVYFKLDQPGFIYLISAALTAGLIIYRGWGQPNIFKMYSFRWGLQLSIFEVVHLSGGSLLNVSVVNISLGLIIFLIGEWWCWRHHRLHPEVVDWEMPPLLAGKLPIINAILGTLFRIGYFNSWTGFLSIGAAINGLGVARRKAEWKILAYISLTGISLGLYELLTYQMILHAQGGSYANAFTLWAGLALIIAFIDNLIAIPLTRLLHLSLKEINITSHSHWGLGNILMFIGVGITLTEVNAGLPIPSLTIIAIIISLLLGIYALAQGRNNPHLKTAHIWVYAGVIEIVSLWVYIRLIWTNLSILDAWIAAIACLIAYIICILPWRYWGWATTPWKNVSGILPAATALATSAFITPENLLVVAIFYVWFAKRINNVRSTYMSVVLFDWAIWRWFLDWNLKDLLWYSTPVGLSLIYIAQFDHALRLPNQKQSRHTLRLLGISGICVVAFLFNQENGLIPVILSLVAIFAGLAGRVRAFLYIGTATFLLTVLYQSVVLIFQYPFFKWIIGLILGIGLISLAANFETRREQITSLVRYWLAELAEWD